MSADRIYLACIVTWFCSIVLVSPAVNAISEGTTKMVFVVLLVVAAITWLWDSL